MLIQESCYGGTEVKVLKFVEILAADQLKKQVSKSLEQAEEAAAVGEDHDDHDDDNEKAQEAADQSDIESNVSGNEELRQIKENKAVISEKNVPKSIKNLKRTALALIFCVITIACKFFWFFRN